VLKENGLTCYSLSTKTTFTLVKWEKNKWGKKQGESPNYPGNGTNTEKENYSQTRCVCEYLKSLSCSRRVERRALRNCVVDPPGSRRLNGVVRPGTAAMR